MSTSASLLFYVCAAIAVATAVFTVSLRSPLRAAVALLGHIVSLAGLYLTLNAHFLAALQLLVYAGAVVVLFVFTIMLIGPSAESLANPKTVGVRVFGVSLVLMLALGGAFKLAAVEQPVPVIAACTAAQGAECGQFGGVRALGMNLYQQAVVPFELVSILLLVAIVGAVAVARGRTAKEAEAAKARRRAREEREAEEAARAKSMSAEVAAHGGH